MALILALVTAIYAAGATLEIRHGFVDAPRGNVVGWAKGSGCDQRQCAHILVEISPELRIDTEYGHAVLAHELAHGLTYARSGIPADGVPPTDNLGHEKPAVAPRYHRPDGQGNDYCYNTPGEWAACETARTGWFQ